MTETLDCCSGDGGLREQVYQLAREGVYADLVQNRTGGIAKEVAAIVCEVTGGTAPSVSEERIRAMIREELTSLLFRARIAL